MATKAEREHMIRVARLGCLACKKDGYLTPEVELHHPRHGVGMGRKASHYDVLPLCHAHHRTGGHGIAFHAGKQAWEAKYGTETELLEEVQTLLGAHQAA